MITFEDETTLEVQVSFGFLPVRVLLTHRDRSNDERMTISMISIEGVAAGYLRLHAGNTYYSSMRQSDRYNSLV